ncbi:MAG: flagellar biosynthesis protein FlhB [Proteobacteria bacterium]|nr:flagellar biosynthesis protein FlhB [Pseudomonadota bacterium]
MSEDADRESKTEQPTEKRLADAKKEGRGPVSRDVPIMFNMAAVWLACILFLGSGAIQIAVTLRPLLEQSGTWDLRAATDMSSLLLYLAMSILPAALPMLALMAIAGVCGSIVQDNGISLKRIHPDFSRISPIAGWKRLFSFAGLSNGAKSFLKIAVVAFVAAWSLQDITNIFKSVGVPGALELGHLVGLATGHLARNVFAAILVLAFADAAMARYFWRRDLMMTKQELKDEAKDSEGDQKAKHRMRFLARQRLKTRMMAAVPKATVVIANPTHFAVALRYRREEGGAPRVVAKGQDAVALRIRRVAEENGVPVVENKALARALFDAVPVDAMLPPEFYKAVAQIIFSIMHPKGARRR